MVTIIIKSGKGGSKNPQFHPHFNRATGCYYNTRKEFDADLKAKGLQLSTGYDPKPNRKEYKPSEWAKAMYGTINASTKKGKFKPSDKFLSELEKKGQKMPSKESISVDISKGGFDQVKVNRPKKSNKEK